MITAKLGAYFFLIFANFSFSQASAMASASLEKATDPDVVVVAPLSLRLPEYEPIVLPIGVGRAVGCSGTV